MFSCEWGWRQCGLFFIMHIKARDDLREGLRGINFPLIPSLDLPTIVGITSFMPLSGKEMVRLYEENGWAILRQKGSHLQVGKGTERETIPMHRELKKGLERKLLKRLGVKRGDL